MSEKYETEVGVDVAKSELCTSIGTKIKSFPNSPGGIKALFAAITKATADAKAAVATEDFRSAMGAMALLRGQDAYWNNAFEIAARKAERHV